MNLRNHITGKIESVCVSVCMCVGGFKLHDKLLHKIRFPFLVPHHSMQYIQKRENEGIPPVHCIFPFYSSLQTKMIQAFVKFFNVKLNDVFIF